MLDVSLRDLMKAGAHFGHQTFRWDPKMRDYIFTARNGIHIIDLDKTLVAIRAACEVVIDTIAAGKRVLFVGTKRQAQDILAESAQQCGMPYVVHRWLGGMLTNFNTIRDSVQRLEKTEEILNSEELQRKYTKKELGHLAKDVAKLRRNLGGILEMRHLPGALFVIDPKTERIAVREANREGIPVIAVTDTNCDPAGIDRVIPGNDDAIKSIELFASAIKEAVFIGQQKFEERVQREAAQREAEQKAAEKKAKEDEIAASPAAKEAYEEQLDSTDV